ncbi:hypothetical protein GCM10009087_52010 [Sphingomonas oligophenolica]|uniref:Uncharacterized protein n=1 Tax=Sphingomonas oligophenolica TaxID=301154 RepID=A0ABU9Y6W2_9SPHN
MKAGLATLARRHFRPVRAGAFVAFIGLFSAAVLLHPPLSAGERAQWTARFGDRQLYPDARLRAMDETADPDMANLIEAELARRAATR